MSHPPPPQPRPRESGEHGDPAAQDPGFRRDDYPPIIENDNQTIIESFSSFEELVDWVGQEREGLLQASLIYHAHLVDFSPPTLTLRLLPEAPKDLPRQLEVLLKKKRDEAWTIAISNEIGHPTLHEKEQQMLEDRKQALLRAPLVKLLMDNFPGTTIIHNEDR